MSDAEIDHEFTKEIVCPHCGHVMSDSWEVHVDDGDVIETDCGECLQVFDVTKHVSVKYSTSKKT